jgi:hypothetical protein
MEVEEVNPLECQYTRAIDCESVPYALKTTYTDPCGCNTWSCCRPICKKKGCKILCAYSYQPDPTCEECCCTDCCCCPRLATRWDYAECRRKGLAWLPDIYFKGYNCGNKAAAQLVGNIYPNDDNCFGQVRKPYKAIASDICI